MTPLATGPSTEAVLDDPLEWARFSRRVTGRDGRTLTESALQVSGITCAACADIIEHALRQVDGVSQASVSAAAQRATVCWDPERTKVSLLVDAIRRAGYDAVPDAAAPARALRLTEQRRALWRLFVAWFCMMQVMMLATPAYVAEAGDLAPDLRQLLNWGQWVLSLPVLAFSAVPMLAGAWQALRRRRISMDVPVALGLLVIFVASTGAAFDPGGPFGVEVYFDSLTMFVAFLLTARWFELKMRHRAVEQLERTLAAMPATARRLRPDGSVENVSVQRLAPGDRLQVPVGEAFAADGLLLNGPTSVDEAVLTGESTPVPRAEGEPVIAGSLNLEAPVTMQVERVGADTRFEQIVAMMQRAVTQRPAMARVADRYAGAFLWTVLALAAASAAVWSVVDPPRALWVAVSVLIVTCPCALSLATPSVMVVAAGALARRGVVLQRLEALEGLATARRMFVDKTGTLTDERPQLAGVDLVEGCELDEAAALRIAASIAGASNHPLSQALSRQGPEVALAIHDVRERPGLGLEARDDLGRRWRLGSAEFVGAPRAAEARVWLADDRGPLAGFRFDEGLRAGASEALQAMRDGGVTIVLLSGDTPERASRLAARLPIDEVMASASPEDKLRAVAQAQARGEQVLMVGDGLNDAPVLARADVSVAMGQGALVARARADAVLVSGRWIDIAQARERAIRSMALVRQNLVWAAAYNAACVPLAMMGYLPPWAAGLGMALSSLVVVANAARAGR